MNIIQKIEFKKSKITWNIYENSLGVIKKLTIFHTKTFAEKMDVFFQSFNEKLMIIFLND